MEISCSMYYPILLYGYPPSVDDMRRGFERIARMGFRYAECEVFGYKKPNADELWRQRTTLRKLLDGLGLSIVSFPVTIPELITFDGAKRAECLALFSRSLEIAAEFDSDTVQLNTFPTALEFKNGTPYLDELAFGKTHLLRVQPEFRWSELWEIVVDTFARCTDAARRFGMKLTVEPRVGELVSNTDGLLRLMDAVGDQDLGAVLELAHLNAQKEILPLSVEKLGARIFGVHVSDNDGRDNAHRPIGEGTIDFEGVFQALKKHAFKGYAAVDIAPSRLESIDEEYVACRERIEMMAGTVGL